MTVTPPTQARPPFILALDLGSSSVRAILIDALGREIEGAVVQTKHTLHTTPDGGAEDWPNEMLQRLGNAIDSLLADSPKLAAQIGAVGMSSFVGNVLGLDDHDEPITPLYAYADTRAAPDAARLRATLDEAEVHDRVGTMLHASYLPARLTWLARTQPSAYGQVRRWVAFGDYLYLKLFGQLSTSLSVASWTGLLNRRTLDWDEKMLARLNLSANHLPPLVDADTAFSSLRPEYAERWPALRSVPWYPAIGDGAAANVGSGCVSPDRVALTIGTTGAMRVVVPEGRKTPGEAAIDTPLGLWIYRVDARRGLLGGALTEGGNLFAWLRQTLAPLQDVEAQLAEMQPDSHGLTVLPFLAGERSPGWAENAHATFTGLNLSTTPLDILRAGLEAIALRFALVYRMVNGAVPQARDVIASGGAILASPAWMQIIADALNRPVTACDEAEASSRGVALLALEALGALNDLREAPPALAQTYYPDQARHERYAAAMERQRTLYDELVRRQG
jgi:gluconokinase